MAEIGTFAGNSVTFLRPTRELILSVKYSFSIVPTGNSTPPEKNLKVEKMISKLPKIDFSDMEFRLPSENRPSTVNPENK